MKAIEFLEVVIRGETQAYQEEPKSLSSAEALQRALIERCAALRVFTSFLCAYGDKFRLDPIFLV